jgi:RHS repeat-associated protein
MLLGSAFVLPLAYVQQGHAQFGGNDGLNPNPGTGTEDEKQDEVGRKPYPESAQGGSTGEDGTRTDGYGEETTPSQERESGSGNTGNPYPSTTPKKCSKPDPGPTDYDPDPDPSPDPTEVPSTEDYPDTDEKTPEDETCFSNTFDLFGPGALASGSVKFFTHEFRNPGRVALTAYLPPARAGLPAPFTLNKTTLPHPDDANFTYDRINSIDTGAMKIEFADAPAALLALDPNAFTATEKNTAGQQTRKTTVSFVTDGGTDYFRMDIEELGSVTRYEQTNPELNKLVLETGLYSGGQFHPLRRITTIKNYDNPQLRKERITVEERPTASHAYQVVSDREIWREAFMKHISDLELPGLGVGVGGSGGSGGGASKPGIPLGSAKAWVKDSQGNFYRRHTPHHYWRVVREIIDPAGAQPLTNIWEYYRSSDRNEPGFTRHSIGRIKRYLMHDGRQGRFSYALNRDTAWTPYAGDPEGMITVAEWNPGARTRTVTSTVGGEILSRVVTVHTQTTLHRARSIGPDKIQVTHFYFVPDNQIFGGMPTRIKAPDGTLTTYAYSRTSVGGIQIVMEQGATTNDLTVSEGLRTTAVTNSRGRRIFGEVKAIGHGDAHGKIYGRLAVTAVDNRGRPTATAYHPQSVFPETGAEMGETVAASSPAWQTSTVQFCCGPTSVTDRYGITTHYAYDGLKRLIKSHRIGVTTETVRKGLTTETHRYPETVSASLSPALQGTTGTLVSRSVRNLTDTLMESWSPDPTSATAGDLVKSNSTVTTFQPAAGLSRRTVTTSADNFAQTTDFLLDGRTAKTSGLLWPAMIYTYAVNGIGEITGRSYDDNGTLRETVTTQSDWAGRPVRVDYMDGAFATMHYNSKGQMVRTVDPDGVVTLHAYNAEGERTTTATDLFPVAVYDDEADNIAYGTDAVRFSETVPSVRGGIPVWRTINKVWYTDPVEGILSPVVSRTDRTISGLQYSSWRIGQGATPDDANATFTTRLTTLSGNGNWTEKTTNPDGTYTRTAYAGGLKDITENFGAGNALISSVSTTYDALNRLRSSTDSRTGTTWFAPLYDHDEDGDTPMVRNPAPDVTASDLTRYVEDPGGRVTTLTYDIRGRRIQVDAPDTDVINTDGTTANSPNVTTTGYNPDDTVAEISGAQTYRTTHTYDYAQRMVTLTTYGTETAVTGWKYSPTRGFLTEKNYHGETGDGETDADYIYTDAGRLLTRTWERGVTTTYGYDGGGRMAFADYSDSTPDVIITYDALGRPLTVKNGEGTVVSGIFTIATPLSSSSFIYDPATLSADTETVSHDIDINGTPELTRVIDRSQDNFNRDTGWQLKNGTTIENSVTYDYSVDDGRISSISNPQLSNVSFGYTYEPDSYSLIKTVTGPAHTVTNLWEADRDVLESKQNKADTIIRSSYSYGVNDIGQRTDLTTTFDLGDNNLTSNPGDTEWGYNPKGEVVKADHTIPGLDRAYLYDGIGNRLKSAEGTTNPNDTSATLYTPNALNQYTALGSLNPVHDADGNMTSGPLPAYPTANSTLSWDAENRLINATVNGTTTSYRYDAQSRRIATVTSAGAATLVIYDGWNPVAEYQGNVGTAPALAKTYTWGIDLSGSMQGAGGVGGLLAATDSTGTYYPTYDGNGNVSEYLDAAGSVQAHYEYDPFGRTTVATGSKANDFAYRFSTKPRDAATGLYYYGYRYYDPLTGRWSSRDPIGERGGMNLYGFINNNPTNLIDVLGEKGWVADPEITPSPDHEASIECDGKGGVRVKMPKGGQYDPCCQPCIIAHEQSHADDVMKADPNICKGKLEGTPIAYTDRKTQRDTEIAAYKAQLKCLLEAKDKPNITRACEKSIEVQSKNLLNALRGLEDIKGDDSLPPVPTNEYIAEGKKKVDGGDLGALIQEVAKEVTEDINKEKSKEK